MQEARQDIAGYNQCVQTSEEGELWQLKRMRMCFKKEIERWEDKGEHKWVLGQFLSGGCLGRENGGQHELIGGQEQD